MKILFISIWMASGTLTFVGQIVSNSTPSTSQTYVADNSTISNTPLLAYFSSYSDGPVQVKTITYQ